MSLFTTAESWSDTYKACGAPHQSPVNLSRSFALPCDRLCELEIDKVAISQASVTIESDRGMKLRFGQVKPTAKFNGEGYTCTEAFLFHPAQHTVENVRAEAEFVAKFDSPKGYTLAVSVPVRVSPGETPSTSFFSGFVPYATSVDEPFEVNLGNDWMLQDIVPESRGFYVYEGSWVLPPCESDVTWVVFSSAVTMDPSDFAKLSSRSLAGTRPLQPIGDREVFYNEGEKLESSFQKKDGKVYMRCRRIPREGEEPRDAVKASGLLKQASDMASKDSSIAVSNLQVGLGDSWASLGGLWGVLMVLTVTMLAYLLFSEKGRTFSVSLFSFLMAPFAFIHRTIGEPVFRFVSSFAGFA